MQLCTLMLTLGCIFDEIFSEILETFEQHNNMLDGGASDGKITLKNSLSTKIMCPLASTVRLKI